MRKIIYPCIVFVILMGAYVFYLYSDRASNSAVDPQTLATESPNISAESNSGLGETDDTISSPNQINTTSSKIITEQSIPSPVPDLAILWGNIQTATGETVVGEQLKLYSASLNRQHVTVSNDYGEFLIHDVSPANDYRISVSPRGMYQRYEADIEIDTNQTNVKIILSDLPVGLLTGRIVNVRGVPVPGFQLTIRGLSKPRWTYTVTGDENGQFEINQVAYGGLEMSSNVNQLLKITGLHFKADSSALLNLVVDYGPYTITGHVYDELREPVAGASVLLNWVYRSGGVRSIANRRTMTDPSGKFVINRLGEGPHDLIVSASDAGVYRRNINMGNETGQIEVVLASP